MRVLLADTVSRLMANPPSPTSNGTYATRILPQEDMRVDLGDGRVIALESMDVYTESGKTNSVAVSGWLLVK